MRHLSWRKSRMTKPSLIHPITEIQASHLQVPEWLVMSMKRDKPHFHMSNWLSLLKNLHSVRRKSFTLNLLFDSGTLGTPTSPLSIVMEWQFQLHQASILRKYYSEDLLITCIGKFYVISCFLYAFLKVCLSKRFCEHRGLPK